MKAIELCAALAQAMPLLFECAPAPKEGLRVRTPLLYPDGDVIDVFVLERADGYAVTDFGEALGWLGQQSVSFKLSLKQEFLLDDVCKTLAIDLFNGQLIRRGIVFNDLANAIIEVAQAVARVSSFSFISHYDSAPVLASAGPRQQLALPRESAGPSTADEIEDWLSKRLISFKRDVRKEGKSNRTLKIDFETYAGRHNSLVLLLSAKTRRTVPRVVDRTVASWVDLNHLKESHLGQTFVSLFDDKIDVWRDEDFRQLEPHSEIAFWSHPEEIERLLTTH